MLSLRNVSVILLIFIIISFDKALIIRTILSRNRNLFQTFVLKSIKIDTNELLSSIIDIDVTRLSDFSVLLENKNDLSMDELQGGNINYCFKLFQKNNPKEKALFVKVS